MLRVDHEGDVVRLTLERPDVGNALDGELIERVTRTLGELAGEADLRAVVITGAGRVFSAGADLGAMKAMRKARYEENLNDARRAAGLFAACHEFPRPVIARVNGPARGGGVGLIAACDLAVATESAHFAFTEVRVGVVPAVISPFVVRKIGIGTARRLFLTGETFDARRAREIGLVDTVVPAAELDGAVDELLTVLRKCAPGATGEVKRLLRLIESGDSAEIRERTAEWIARIRVGEEAQEGMAAFLEKRPPRWAV